MDIGILLALQDFRNGGGAFLADFLSKMTYLGELNTVIVIMAIIYWSVSKEFGTYLLMGWSGNRIANGALKVTACAYRPWVRDARIVPYGNSITTATGYSFPSGHTMNAATVFGGGSVRKDLPGLLGYYMVSLIFVPLIKNGISGPAGTVLSCFVQLLYVTFIFPWCLKYLEKPAAQVQSKKKYAKVDIGKPLPSDFGRGFSMLLYIFDAGYDHCRVLAISLRRDFCGSPWDPSC